MASFTIEKRAKANGDFSYRCTIRVKESGEIIHRESKTFSKKEVARTWGKTRCDAIENDSVLQKNKAILIGELLTVFLKMLTFGQELAALSNMLFVC